MANRVPRESQLVRQALLEMGGVGVLAGGVVSGLFWSWLGSVWLPAALLGALVGIPLGIVVGSGLVKEAWSGPIGAFVITAVTVAFANVVVLVALLSHGQ